jgi:hypothetical protein
MFVVGTVQRIAHTDDTTQFDLSWPVVIEDDTLGFVGGTVGQCASRDLADSLASDLNKVLTKYAKPSS